MASTSVSTLAFFTFLWIFVLEVSSWDAVITSKPGDTVTLPCQGPEDIDTAGVWWNREEVILCHNKNPNENDRCEEESLPPSFQNRIQLDNSGVKNGRMSLILKNVERNDAGIYGCSFYHYKKFIYCTVDIITRVLLTVEQDVITIRAKPGDTVTLPCQDPMLTHFTTVMWKREEETICYNSDFKEDNGCYIVRLDPPFLPGVQLNSWVKKGDVSLILKNVVGSDSGRYHCYVGGTPWRNSANQALIGIVHLTVEPDVTNITAKPGDNVTLPCQSPEITVFTIVEWKKEEETICVNRNPTENDRCEGQILPPLFQNRVQMNTSWVKDGDVSLVLNNVHISDSGRYDCHVRHNGLYRRKRSADVNDDVISIVHLTVEPGPTEDGGDEHAGRNRPVSTMSPPN